MSSESEKSAQIGILTHAKCAQGIFVSRQKSAPQGQLQLYRMNHGQQRISYQLKLVVELK